MARITLTLSARTSKDTGKAEILLRYRNTREVALRAHTRVFILPKYFVDGKIVIKNRLITPEVKEAQEAKALIERIINPSQKNETYYIKQTSAQANSTTSSVKPSKKQASHA